MTRAIVGVGILISSLILPVGVSTQAAQFAQTEPQGSPLVNSQQAAKTGEVAASEVGQRQGRDAIATKVTGTPLSRVSSRISNRVQSRIRNRIDSNYDPTANATSPFLVASEQFRVASRRR